MLSVEAQGFAGVPTPIAGRAEVAEPDIKDSRKEMLRVIKLLKQTDEVLDFDYFEDDQNNSQALDFDHFQQLVKQVLRTNELSEQQQSE